MSEKIGPPKRKRERSGYKIGTHPNSAAARKRYEWKPGQSGNIAGKPKSSFSKDLRELFADFDPKARKTNSQKLAWKYFLKALSGDLKSLEVLLDRAEGKPVQRAEFSGPDGSSIPINLEAIDARLGELLQRARSAAPHGGGKS